MNGNLGYCAGVDRTHNAMRNISIWKSVADANQPLGISGTILIYWSGTDP
jgi:hypothetical protein